MFKAKSSFVQQTKTSWSNWAKNVQFQPEQICYPTTEAEIVTLIQKAKETGKRIRVVGNGHSFSPLVKTEEILLSLSAMTGIIGVDKEQQIATAWAGTSIKDANAALYEYGVAMINLGDIDVQSIAGATATGTHGTGTAFGNLSSEIVGFTIITADGTIRQCSATQEAELFEAGRISLGVLGIITQISFRVMEAYKLEYTSSTGLFDDVVKDFQQYNEDNRNFEFYYFPYSETLQLKRSNITDKPVKNNKILAHFNDVFLENTMLNLVTRIGKHFAKSFKGVSRLLASSIPHKTTIDYSHKIYATVRNVRFKEMEYNIPVEHFQACIKEVQQYIEGNEIRIFFPLECRFVKQDDIWLSPAYQRDSAYIAAHTVADMPHEAYFEALEAIFIKYEGRPHWGKMHQRSAQSLATAYPRWDDFMALRQKLDPTGVFLSPYLSNMFGVE